MIIVMRPDHQDEDLDRIVRRLEDMGLNSYFEGRAKDYCRGDWR